jgi:hypothetical protein
MQPRHKGRAAGVAWRGGWYGWQAGSGEYWVSVGWRVARGYQVTSGIGRVGEGARLASAPEPGGNDSYLFDLLFSCLVVVDYFGI